MPQASTEAVVPHAFAQHDFTVVFADSPGEDPDVVDAARAAVEKELRDLMPSRAAWRNDVRWSWAPSNDAVTVSDQRAAAFFAGVLRRHRVIRAGEAEIRPASNASADSTRVAETRMNLDEDLFAACTASVTEGPLHAAIGSATPTVATVAAYVREHGGFLGAYGSDGAPNPVVVGAAALKGVMTMGDLQTLVRDHSRFVRGMALLFARFALPPEEIAPLFGVLPEAAATAKKPPAVWADAPVLDGTVVAFDDEGSHGPFKDFARQLLLDDEVYELWLPTYAPSVVDALRRRIELTEKVATGKHEAVAAAPSSTATKPADQTGANATGAKPKKSGTVVAGFKSATAMAKYFRKAYELAERGATTSATNMGTGSIVVRAPGAAGSGTTLPSNAAAAAQPEASGSSSAGLPRGVAAKTREELMAQMKQRRLDRLRGGAAAALTQHRKRAANEAREALPVIGASGAAADDGEAGIQLWPSEVVGPINQGGAIDDLFKDKAQLRMLFSATVGPEDVEVTF